MTDTKKRILYVQYTNPGVYPPLDHSSHILAEAGWEILFLGIALHPQMTLTPHPRIQVKTLPEVAPGWQQKVHYFYYLLWMMIWVLRWRPMWIYASDPLSTPIALLLTYLPRLKVLYHEHDSPDERTPTTAFMRLILKTRRQVARRVAANVLPNATRGDLLRHSSNTTRSILTVWNCPGYAEVPTLSNKPAMPLRLLYNGTIVPQRLPLTIIEAIAQVSDEVELHVIGYETIGATGYSQTLRDHATHLGISHRLVLHGTVATRADLLRLTAQCHIGLAFMPLETNDLNLETMAGASNKPFDYMVCGLALLVSPLPEWEALYVTQGYGLASNPADPTALTQAIQWYVDHPIERQQMGEAGRQQILKGWNYETQFQSVLALLETSLGTPTTVIAQ
jgi:glycosyltransferase involved in cell wall biosynthesis